MQITIRQSVRKELADKIPSLVDAAIKWMANKYPDVDFDKPSFIFSSGYSRCRYYRNEVKDGKYLAPNVCISTSAKLGLYPMKSLGIKKTKWIFVGSEVNMFCGLIHELTHHVQYEKKLSTGELLTTANELEYLKENHPNYYKKLLK
jgi:hypothetical protein